jgi:hypothetical protein
MMILLLEFGHAPKIASWLEVEAEDRRVRLRLDEQALARLH